MHIELKFATNLVFLAMITQGIRNNRAYVTIQKKKKQFIEPLGCVKKTVLERRQHQFGRMADFLPPVTFS